MKNITKIENEYRKFIMIYCNESTMRSAINDYSYVDIKSFNMTWEIIKEWFEILYNFYKEIVMIFVNIVFVESDFSILGWEKNKYRLTIMDLSLEGILHCKQYKKLGGFVLWEGEDKI